MRKAALADLDLSNARNQFEREDALKAIEPLVPSMLAWAAPKPTTIATRARRGPPASHCASPRPARRPRL
eukprot:9324197-Alexandrium_andersonii.AAC.1